MKKRTNRQAVARDGKRTRRGRLQEQAVAPINFSAAARPAKANRRGTNVASLANLQRGTHTPAAKALHISPARAEAFVKLRSAGMPEHVAIAFVYQGEPDCPKTEKQIAAAVKQFAEAPEVVDAYAEFNGAAWQDLEEDMRTEVALRLHTAQCAYLLYTTDISDPMAPMKKIDYAKTVILQQLELAKEHGDGDKFTLFMQQLVGNANAAMPPTFKAAGSDGKVLPTIPAEFVTKGKES